MTLESEESERFIFLAYYKLYPVDPDFPIFSLPAKSTRFILAILPPPTSDYTLNSIITITCDLDES
jgi:hypothetical protein